MRLWWIPYTAGVSIQKPKRPFPLSCKTPTAISDIDVALSLFSFSSELSHFIYKNLLCYSTFFSLKISNNCERDCTTCMITYYSVFFLTDRHSRDYSRPYPYGFNFSCQWKMIRWSQNYVKQHGSCKIWTECINVSLPCICSGSSGNMSHTYP